MVDNFQSDKSQTWIKINFISNIGWKFEIDRVTVLNWQENVKKFNRAWKEQKIEKYPEEKSPKNVGISHGYNDRMDVLQASM